MQISLILRHRSVSELYQMKLKMATASAAFSSHFRKNLPMRLRQNSVASRLFCVYNKTDFTEELLN